MSLHDLIVQRIRETGPVSLADYMAECLLQPSLGYYTTQEPFGRAGDFTTAPEISQMFGELIGLCLAQSWLDQGRPPRVTLAELGPGRGTLMADALRATLRVPGFHAAVEIVLLEVSQSLRAQQRSALADYEVSFIDTAQGLPEQPLLAIANEFFDALPIRQFVRTETGWRERQIGLDGDRLTFGLGPESPQPALASRLADTHLGDIIEVCASATPVCDALGARISAHGGAALLIDYGDWRSLGDTFQAVHAHRTADPLEAPGRADLTAHVDFEALAEAAPCAHTRLTPQGVFLERLGITARAEALAKGLSGDRLQSHISAHRRLTHPDEMGNLFKVLGLFPEGSSPPPGLDV